MEAQAAGMYIVTSPIAALNETCPGACFVDGDWRSIEYAEEFTRAVVLQLEAGKRCGHNVAGKARAESFCLDSLAADWDATLLQIRADVTERVVPAFREAAE
jgi:hypothetical protein